MTKQEAIEQLRELAKNDDYESAHINADGVLAEFLISLGHKDVVDEYEKVGKWYA